jgi:hypothetical protein
MRQYFLLANYTGEEVAECLKIHRAETRPHPDYDCRFQARSVDRYGAGVKVFCRPIGRGLFTVLLI